MGVKYACPEVCVTPGKFSKMKQAGVDGLWISKILFPSLDE